MIYWLIKNWRLFLDIILVIGIVILFTFWDPFGLFTNAKTRTTANLISSVKSIGQLVTAEYQGEVISSWKEYQLTEYSIDTLRQYAEETYVDLQYQLDQILDNGTERKALKPQIKNKDNLYPSLIAFLATHYYGKSIDDVLDRKNHLKQKWEEKVLKRMVKILRQEKRNLHKKHKDSSVLENKALVDFLNQTPSYLEGYMAAYHSTVTIKQSSRKGKKNKIVFIGRGIVKAGFDFGQLNEDNFLYNKSDKIIHFYGIKPKVLDTDINPWFIPERKVKGFELVDYSGAVNFEHAKKVKIKCKQKLLAQAQSADIIARAEQNGKETLQHLFSILLDEPELKVSFHTHPLDHFYAAIAADSLVTRSEALLIAQLYHSQDSSIHQISDQQQKEKLRLHLKRFIQRSKTLYFDDTNQYFNFYSMLGAQLLLDSAHVSLSDIDTLRMMRGQLSTSSDGSRLTTSIVKAHPLWFEQGEFMQEYNQLLDWLSINSDSLVGRYSDRLSDFNRVQANTVVASTMQDTLNIQYYYKDSINHYNYRLEDMKYPEFITDSTSVASQLPIHPIMKTLFNADLDSIKSVKKNQALRKNDNPILDLKRVVRDLIEQLQIN